ncbi:hypothetical protein CVT25_006391 [Psilocybe cyanescens]|uniref:Uncharacterized protein n=1 Tax=Psilocybe cyanescens TaxID=93625 RepID=A0A409XKG1_PSICY|nr:hypothetical protein CVT25_006391 [Psilocybe cyanescens]
MFRVDIVAVVMKESIRYTAAVLVHTRPAGFSSNPATPLPRLRRILPQPPILTEDEQRPVANPSPNPRTRGPSFCKTMKGMTRSRHLDVHRFEGWKVGNME